MSRRLQLSLLTLSALVVLVIGVSLLAVLIVGMADGIAGSGPLVLGLVTLGVFALGIRLLFVVRAVRRSTPPDAAARMPVPSAPTPRPRPRPRTGTERSAAHSAERSELNSQ